MSSGAGPEISAGDTAWMMTSSAFVLLMTPGLSFFYGGLVNERNVLNTMMMSIISMGVVTLPWMLFGFSIAFGSGGPLLGDFQYAALTRLDETVWPGTHVPGLVFFVFQLTFAIIGAAIISGSVAERMRFGAWAIFIALWCLVVYAPVCHWVWGPGGWIDEIGAKDFAGGAVVHESSSISARVLARLLGPRMAVVHRPSEASESEPHNVPTVILGAALLWFGWSGFNGGSALAADFIAALALVNTYLSAGAALVSWSLVERWWKGRWSAIGTVTGAIIGLVVITPAAGYVTPCGATAMGFLGALVVFPSFQIDGMATLGVDDRLDAFPCHGVSGIVGTVLTGFFAKEGGLLYGGGWKLLGAQCVAASAICVYATVMTTLIFCLMRCCMKMRVDEDDEMLGIDHSIHGETAYHTSSAKAVDPWSACFGDLEATSSDESGEELAAGPERRTSTILTTGSPFAV